MRHAALEEQAAFRAALPFRYPLLPLPVACTAQWSHSGDRRPEVAARSDDGGVGACANAVANDATVACSQIHFSLHEGIVVDPALRRDESIQTVAWLVFFYQLGFSFGIEPNLGFA